MVVTTAATDAVYVMFNAALSSRRSVPARWSSVWYLLSAFAVIRYMRKWLYVCFAADGFWMGAYVSMTILQRAKGASGPELVERLEVGTLRIFG
ncbi:MAG: hypothetical protein M3Y50_16860 [Acidobacteriota bacterium]|nr:hypothetical protein [Acidobacteriota bacterium]